MALVVADRVQETSLTSGTGTLTLTGALAGYQTFSTAIGNGNTTFYTIYDPNAYDWEVGIGTVGAGTLARTTVLSNSAGTTSPISFAGNSKFVFCTYPAEKSINYDANGVATIGDVLGYSDTGIVGSFASTVAGYNQVIVQNKSTATNASSNLNVSNDAGTAGSNYAELGINSSTFTGAGSFNIAGAAYVASAGTDLTIGTYNANDIHFVTNSNTVDAMTIHDNGGISLGALLNPGIGNLAAKKLVPGYTAVTSAAGTTVLTADSNYYQNLLGSTTQTFQLPDATTLLVGTTFIFDNDSSGILTVVDNASGPIETIPGGAADFVYLANNSTVAGTWRRHAFLPASYDFNSTTANFGNATITNATWNGNTIGTAYGGTGLTSFSAANYALYSTSSSALTAGTLPVAAGGSGAVTFTANGVLYGNGTSALGVTAAGTTGQVLLANTSGAPTWGSVPSTGAVTSFQTSLSGLTPSTATTGAVTLAGTLGISSGGTGETTRQAAIDALAGAVTSGQYLRGNGTDVVMSAIQVTDVPTLNQNTTGSAATLTTARTIYGNSFNGSADLTQVIASTYGGTGNGFTKFSGPTTSEKTFTLPDATTTILTTNAAVTIAQGGTGTTTAQGAMNTFAGAVTSGSYLRGNGTNVVMATIQAADVPTLNQNTTGSSGSCTGNAATVTNGLYTTGNQTIAARTIQQGSQNVGTMLTATGSLGGLEMVSAGSGNAAFMTFHKPGNYASYFGIDTDNNFAVGGWSAGAALANFKAGSLGIGTAASGTAGEIRATNNITAFYSDARLKDFKGTIPNALDKVLALNGYYFTENQKAKELGYNNDKMQVGVSAQEVEAVMPEVVTDAPINANFEGADYKTVYYDKLVPLLIEAIKELKAEIDELKGK